MFIASIKKVIARDSERTILDSSVEEFQNFVVNMSRTDFESKNVLCVKFLFSENGNFNDTEESPWYINPIYYPKLTDMDFLDYNDSFQSTTSPLSEITLATSDLIMPSEFLPEILLIDCSENKFNIFEEYSGFYNTLLADGLTDLDDEEKFRRFVDILRDNL